MPFDDYHFNMFYCTNRKLTPSQSTTTTDAPALAAVAPVRTPTPRTTNPKTFLWTKSGRRRSTSNLKLLSANRRADATTASPPLLSRRRTLVDATELDIVDAVPAVDASRTRTSESSYSVRDADFGY